MAQKVQNSNITYRDQKDIMKNIFGQGRMVPYKANYQVGGSIIQKKQASSKKTKINDSVFSQQERELRLAV